MGRHYGTKPVRQPFLHRAPRIRAWLWVLFGIGAYFGFQLLLLAAGLDAMRSALIGGLMCAALLSCLYGKGLCGIAHARPGREPSFRDYGFWAVLFLCAAVVLEGLFHFIDSHVADVGMAARAESISQDVVLFALMSVLTAPLVEEVLMRLFCYGVLRGPCSKPVAVLSTAFIFAAMHGTVAHMIVATVLGCILAFSYEATGKWFVPVIGHYVYNFAVLFGSSGEFLSLSEEPVMGVTYILLASVLFLAAWRRAFPGVFAGCSRKGV